MALSPAYLNAIGAALGDPFAAGAAAAGISPAPAPLPPVPVDQVTASNVSLAPVPTLTQGGTFATGLPQPPAPDPALAAPPPSNAPQAGPPPMPIPNGAEPTPTEAPPLLMRIGGGGVAPAHEVDLRGPSLRAQQGVANQALESAIGANQENAAEQSAHEYAVYLEQEREARTREAAAQQSVAEREQEMATRLADFDASVKNLSKMSIDRDRWFASRSTPQKVFAFLELGLAGFRGAPSMVMKRIDDDVRAQEFAYQVARDTADATKTAFGLAMQKYQNADAARAMVRAAALDAAQAQTAQLGALAKDTAAANHANTMFAALEDQKMQQIQQGVRFMPATAAQERYLDTSTGMVLNRAEALKRLDTLEGRRAEEQKQLTDIGGRMAVEQMKLEGDRAVKRGENTVVLPNGESIAAPSSAEATELRKLATAVSNANQLVEEAKAIRSDPSWTVSPSKYGRLKQLEAELTLAFKDRGQLGALSGPDMDLAAKATADLTSFAPGVDARLDAFAKTTGNALRNRVRTVPGAPPKASGKMPGSTQYAGGKK